MDSEVVDYLVVGAGSAGAIVAARLSEDPDVSVMLLEAGPNDKSPLIHVPAAARYAFNAASLNWNYVTEPEPNLGNRTIEQPRVKVLGGRDENIAVWEGRVSGAWANARGKRTPSAASASSWGVA